MALSTHINQFKKFFTISPQGIFVLYDLTMRHSFERVKFWLTVIETVCPTPSSSHLPHSHHANYVLQNASASGLEMMLVATKCDDWPNRKVTTTEGMRFAEEHHMAYIETSASSNHNITEVHSHVFMLPYPCPCKKRHLKPLQWFPLTRPFPQTSISLLSGGCFGGGGGIVVVGGVTLIIWGRQRPKISVKLAVLAKLKTESNVFGLVLYAGL